MITFIHAADFHLDAPFASLPPPHAAARREEQRALLSRLADAAEGADLVFLSGDVLDGARTYYETTQTLARTLGRMRARVFIAPGNHDFYSARSPWASLSWPENVHIFRTQQVERVDLPELNCAVYGSAFTAPFRDDSPLAGFAVPRDGRLHLMCVHGDVDGGERYGSIPSQEIAASGLTYLALGHVHAASGLRYAEDTAWAYPGCPEGRGFDELGEKGILRGSVDQAGLRLEFIPLAGRRYELLSVDVTGEDPAAALAAALPKGAGRDIYRIFLTGESGEDGLDLTALEELAAPYFYSVSLRDRTRVRRDLWSRAGEDSLTGLFLRELRGRLEAAGSDAERENVERAVRFGLAALENREDCYL